MLNFAYDIHSCVASYTDLLSVSDTVSHQLLRIYCFKSIILATAKLILVMRLRASDNNNRRIHLMDYFNQN